MPVFVAFGLGDDLEPRSRQPCQDRRSGRVVVEADAFEVLARHDRMSGGPRLLVRPVDVCGVSLLDRHVQRASWSDRGRERRDDRRPVLGADILEGVDADDCVEELDEREVLECHASGWHLGMFEARDVEPMVAPRRRSGLVGAPDRRGEWAASRLAVGRAPACSCGPSSCAIATPGSHGRSEPPGSASSLGIARR